MQSVSFRQEHCAWEKSGFQAVVDKSPPVSCAFFLLRITEVFVCSSYCCCYVASVVCDSVQPHRRQPTRLPRPWDSPGKNTGVGCHFLLQYMKVKSEVAQSCPTLSDPMDCSLPGSSVHGIFQARALEHSIKSRSFRVSKPEIRLSLLCHNSAILRSYLTFSKLQLQICKIVLTLQDLYEYLLRSLLSIHTTCV